MEENDRKTSLTPVPLIYGYKLKIIAKALFCSGVIVSILVLIDSYQDNYVNDKVFINHFFILPVKTTIGIGALMALLLVLYENIGYGNISNIDDIVIYNELNLKNIIQFFYALITMLFMPFGGYVFAIVFIEINIKLIKILIK